MTSSLQGFNPFAKELNIKSGAVAAVIITGAVIGSALGTIVFLASFGIPLGPLNVLGTLTPTGGAVLIGGSLIGGGAALVWLIIKGFHRKKGLSSANVGKVIQALIQDEECRHALDKVDIATLQQALYDNRKALQQASHPKALFASMMQTFVDRNAEVYFPRPKAPTKGLDLDTEPEERDLEIDAGVTCGLNFDIVKASNDAEKIHLFSVPLPYYPINRKTKQGSLFPSPGCIMQQTQGESQSGSIAQRTNPLAFELEYACLDWAGFNRFEEALPSAGSPMKQDSALYNWYLTPTSENLETLTTEYLKNYQKTEYVCYSSLPETGGNQPVYLMLQAAPNMRSVNIDLEETWAPSESGKKNKDLLEKTAAYANYSALLQQAVDLAMDKRKPVVVHLSQFDGNICELDQQWLGNENKNTDWGLNTAIAEFSSQLEEYDISLTLPSLNSKNRPS